MSIRKVLAVGGACGILFHFALTAYGYEDLGDLLRTVVSDQQLITASVAVELGGFRSDSAAADQSPESTVAPSLTTPAPTSDAQETQEEQEEILEASITGGMTIDNETEYDIDIAQLLIEGPSLTLSGDGPQILIIHTHSSEAYTMDSVDRYEPSDNGRTQDTNYNIIRIGEELTEGLRDCGLNVIHDTTIYDYPSYTGSYTRSGEAIETYLKEYPTISMVIDVHRDAIGDGDVVYKTVAETENSASAQAMFVVGTNGSGLDHPNWEENLKLALYLQNAVNPKHPTLMRPIKLVNERYNQQLTTGSLILEVGSSGNTLQEALTAARLFAESAGPALAKLLR